MCGILGGIALSNTKIDQDKFKDSLRLLKHRGPDDTGVYFHPQLALGHTRLSIRDLSQDGHQPMVCNKTGVVLIYNGEIYNHLELKQILKSKGYNFSSNSDTEVVLYSFIEWGHDCLSKFNGMFSLAFYDPSTLKITIARDRFGIKPLYLFESEDEIVFSSEIKAIKHYVTNKLSGLNYQGLTEYLWFGNALGANTLYKNIKRVRPAEFIVFDRLREQLQKGVFWNVNNLVANQSISYSDSVVQTRILLQQAVESHLDSDVPVGVLLSGGIDSSAITAFASKASSSPIKTFSAGFDFDKGVNELKEAKQVAEKFKTEHHEIHISGADLSDFVPSLVDIHDEPFGDAANIPLYLISKKLKGDISVLLQGDGGDEIFGGYKRYLAMNLFSIIPGKLHLFFYPQIKEFEYPNYQYAVKRGVGLCSQNALALSDYMSRLGYVSKAYGIDGHVVNETIFDKGQRIILDGDMNVVLPFSLDYAKTHPEKIKNIYIEKGYSDKLSNDIALMYGSGYAPYKNHLSRIWKLTLYFNWFMPTSSLALSIFFFIKFQRRKKVHNLNSVNIINGYS